MGKYLWNDQTIIKKIDHDHNSLNFTNCAKTVRAHLELFKRDGMNIGSCLCGFLVDGHKEEKELEEHYITTTGIVVVRTHNTNRVVSIRVAGVKQIKNYYDSLGYVVPSQLIEYVKNNPKIRK